jgi:plastocyanin
MKRLVFIAIAAIFLGIGLALVGSGSSKATASPAQVQDVKIENFTFGPAFLTVVPGTTVRWTNRDDIPHTVVSEDVSFKSKALDTGDQYTYTFEKPGTYQYICTLHPRMQATITVK